MNPSELLVYSFLMKKNIEFTRIYHGKNDIELFLKKTGTVAELPVVNLWHGKNSSDYIIYIHLDNTENNLYLDDYKRADKKENEKFSKLLFCHGESLSPLGLIFEKNKICKVVTNIETISRKAVLCLSPCSDESSVLIDTEDLFYKFITATGHSVEIL